MADKISIDFSSSDFNEIFFPLLKDESRYLQLYGGAGSGKSFFAAQKLFWRTVKENSHRILLVRKVARTIRTSQFNLLKSLIINSGAFEYFEVRESDNYIRNKLTGSEFISAGMDDREKIKSIFGITSIWIEEATELEREDFIQLNLRLRGKTLSYKQIILTYNPVNANHWLNKIRLRNSRILKTTYKDNKYIDEDYKNILEDLKEQDEQYYNIYALGEWGVLKNIIYRQFPLINQYPEEFEEIIYGLDFGFNNKTALIEAGIKDNSYYLNELIYESGLTNAGLIEKMKLLNIKKNKYIFCDSSEPNRIEEIRRAGFNSHPAEKNVKDGINFLKTCSIFSRQENSGINGEVISYSYKQDKEGNVLDEPVKFNDHAMDAIRYAIYSYKKRRGRILSKWI